MYLCVFFPLFVRNEEVEQTKKKLSVVAHLLTFDEEDASALDSRPRGRKQMLVSE